MSIQQHAQRLQLDPRITLFDVDLTELGGTVQRIVPMSQLLGKGREWVFTRSGAGTAYTTLIFDSPVYPSGGWMYFRVVYEVPAKANTHMVIRVGDNTDNVSYTANLTDTGDVPSESTSGLGANALSSDFNQAEFQDGYGVAIVAVELGTFEPSGVRLLTSTNFDQGDSVTILEAAAWLGYANGTLSEMPESDNTLENWTTDADGDLTEQVSQQVTTKVLWRGNEYTPVPVEAEGFEKRTTGNLPRPTFRLSNVLGFASNLANNFSNMEGATVTRWKTFRRFLDTGLTPDPNGHMPLDVFTIDRKVSHGKQQIEWEMASILDQQGVMLPGRQVIRSGCQFLYRRHNGVGGFDYTNTTCPYVGTNYFDENDDPTTLANDRCSQQLTGCLLRFPTGDVPFGGFPSVGRIRR